MRVLDSHYVFFIYLFYFTPAQGRGIGRVGVEVRRMTEGIEGILLLSGS